jgi:multiple sugar transport system substrate-binding protein/sn-glycerol 3-phosphate transport system substrate-binding protein
MILRRLLPTLVAAALLVLAMGAFASGSTEAAQGTPLVAGVDPTGATVVYWHQHSGARQKGLQDMVNQFNSSNSYKVQVQEQFAGGYNDIYNKMITAIAAGSTPNLVVAYQNQAAGYQVANALVDMDVYVQDAKWGFTKEEQADFFEGFFLQDKSAQFGGMRLGFPPNRSAEVLFYNKTWLNALGFSAPPKTWDDFYKVVKAARDPSKDRWGYSVRDDASNVFSQVVSRGGTILAFGGAGYKFSSSELKASMELFQKMYKEGIVKKIAEAYGDQTDFGNYKVLFTMGSTSGIPFYDDAVKKGKDGAFDWSVAAIPYTTVKPPVNVYGASVSIPKTTPARQLGAWLFVKWFSEPAQQYRWLEISNYFPVRKSVAANMGAYFAKNPKFKDAWDLLNAGATTAEPPFAGYDEVRDAVTKSFNAILDGADVTKTLADLDVLANKVHKQASP